jgi:hypothetical protein
MCLREGTTDPFVKEADFFVSQNGHREPWGRSWVPVRADGLAHAKLIALVLQTSKVFPTSLSVSNPNRRTVGECVDDGFKYQV